MKAKCAVGRFGKVLDSMAGEMNPVTSFHGGHYTFYKRIFSYHTVDLVVSGLMLDMM